MSELLKRIDAALFGSVSMHHRGELLIRKAIYLARVGRFSESKALFGELSSKFSIDAYPRIAILKILLEGVIDLYENLGERSYDRILRADLLAVATGEPDLISITSAWRAHVEFEKSDFGEMIKAMRRVQKAACADDHDARSRLARVLTDCFTLVGNLPQSKYWFDVAHGHAVSAGDQAMIDALIYNRMAFGLAHARAESVFTKVDPSRLTLIRTSLSSARNYQNLIQTNALVHLVDICEARLGMLSGDFSSSLHKLSAAMHSGPHAKNNFSEDLLNLEIAFVHSKLGMVDEARAFWQKVEDHELPALDIDDRLMAAWMRLQLIEQNVDFGSAEHARRKLELLKEEYKTGIAALSQALVDFEATQ